ncbi:MAG: hypothetical protein GX096_03785 [Clostridiales bacterium]|nr:hypothetical protein [Clostridiales bacterium]
MKRTPLMRKISIVMIAALMTIAPSFDMSVARKLRPDAVDLGGFIFQAIGRTISSISTDSLTLSLLFFVMMWLANRYIFHKPKETKVGEYLLCGFLSIMMLCASSIRATESIQTLYENAFQIVKALLFLAGFFPLLLCAIRGLNELLHDGIKLRCITKWDKHPFLFPMIVIAVAWLPHLIIKYPGVWMIDSCLQFRMYLGMTDPITPHPPFGTLIYGLIVSFALSTPNPNIVYFICTLIQTAIFIAVLSYSLWLMQKHEAPMWMCWLALVLYAISPSYVGWSMVLVKDSSYLILCMLAMALMIDFIGDRKGFMSSKLRLLLLAADIYLMILTRHNGVYIAVPILIGMGIVLLKDKIGKMGMIKLGMLSCAALLLAFGTSEAIIYALNIQHVEMNDWLSIPFQQTARIVKLHGDEIPEEERAAIDQIVPYETIAQLYTINNADPIKWDSNDALDREKDASIYLNTWWKQVKRYPMDALDALLNMNVILFDLQDNFPTYIGLSDNTMYDHVYQYSFNDLSFYNREEIAPLNSIQLALTEWYYRFSDMPVIGPFASMGFCIYVMLMTMYLTCVHKRGRALLAWLPSVISAIFGLFCAIVYTRYLLPTMCALPLWFFSYHVAGQVKEK